MTYRSSCSWQGYDRCEARARWLRKPRSGACLPWESCFLRSKRDRDIDKDCMLTLNWPSSLGGQRKHKRHLPPEVRVPCSLPARIELRRPEQQVSLRRRRTTYV
eukprot:4779487-Pleurochrysis_carterae.AAC.1